MFKRVGFLSTLELLSKGDVSFVGVVFSTKISLCMRSSMRNGFLCCLFFLASWVTHVQCSSAQFEEREIVANIKNACQEYRRTFVPLHLFLSQERREMASEEYRKADICIKTKGEQYQCMEVVYPKEGGANKRVLCKNTKYSFAISADVVDVTMDTAWAIDDVYKGTGTLQDNLGLELYFIEVALRAPVFINHLKLDDFLESPAVRIADVVVNGDDISVKMNIADTTERVNDFHINFFEVELFIRPKSTGWLPYRYIHRERLPNGIFSREVTNSDYKVENGIAVPQKIVATIQESNREPWISEIHAFSWSSENPLTDKEFTLLHYGLPEPDLGEPRPGPFRYTLAVIGLLMITYALWRMYRQRKGGKQ